MGGGGVINKYLFFPFKLTNTSFLLDVFGDRLGSWIFCINGGIVGIRAG
jgi:hypothetical protein